jgi:uncharacterized membrane protein
MTEPPPATPPAPAIHVHPRAVPWQHAFAWYEEAMRLWKRAPAMWAALAATTLVAEFALDALPGAGAVLAPLVAPLVASGMLVAAMAVDRGARPKMSHAVVAFTAPAGAIAAIVAASALTFGAEALAAWWIADVNLLEPDADLSAATIIGTYTVGVLASLPLTFIPFHVLLERVGAAAAFGASFRAFALNAMPLLVYGAVSLLLLAFGLLTLAIGFVIALPLWAASSYAAWKDVFGVRFEELPPTAE